MAAEKRGKVSSRHATIRQANSFWQVLALGATKQKDVISHRFDCEQRSAGASISI